VGPDVAAYNEARLALHTTSWEVGTWCCSLLSGPRQSNAHNTGYNIKHTHFSRNGYVQKRETLTHIW